MPVESGQQLLHYRLVEKIGEGGMGVVWKATDTTLDRHVAVKVLPESLAADPQRLARLEREAKLAASLNHPNIATVHGLHEVAGVRFVAMELVEGDDLAQRLARGPIPHDEAYEIARQIAQGLEAAHSRGVVHRDLKPANVKLDGDGRVKVLDFGLARAFETTPTSSGEVRPTMSPTITSDRTEVGAILGTAAYMSPEQARGQVVDARTDVWAFGAVLYEMISGRSPFRSDTVSDTLASVLKIEPDLGALGPGVPNRIRRLIARCLQKDPRKRFHHIADARIILEETLAGVPDEQGPDDVAIGKRRTAERLGWLAAVALVAVAVAVVTWNLRAAPADRPVRKLQVALDGIGPEDPKLNHADISPDGTRVLYKTGKGRVFVRDLDAWDSLEISAAAEASRIFWSHDGRSIGFIKDRTLSRVDADGTHEAMISELPGETNGAAWGSDGKILLAGHYHERHGLFEVSERGGELVARFLIEDEEDHFHTLDILPDNRGLLITLHHGDMKDVSLLVGDTLTSLVSMETRYLPFPVYADSGHVLYTRGGTNEGLWALPFSAKTLEVEGEPFLVAAGGGDPSSSQYGTLVYRNYAFDPPRRLVWVDREGKVLETILEPRKGVDRPSISPDGTKLVFSMGEESNTDLWVLDLQRGTRSRLTQAEGHERSPAWTPDGKRVIYRQRQGKERTIRVVNADGTGQSEVLAQARSAHLTPDGKFLILHREHNETQRDIWILELDSGAEPVPLVQTRFVESASRVSPDGRFIAYHSDESGSSEIYVKRFPSGEGKWRVSLEGGVTPYWSPKGDELFFVDDKDLMVVDVRTDPDLQLGTSRKVFTWEGGYSLLASHGFDMTADGQRFVVVGHEEEDEATRSKWGLLMLVENWTAE